MPSSKPNRWLIGGWFIVTGLISAVLWWWTRPAVSTKATTLGATSPGLFKPLKITYKINTSSGTATDTAQLLTKIVDKFADAEGEYSLYVYRLDGGGGYGINENSVLPAASTMKVPIMQAVRDNLGLAAEYTLVEEDKRSGSGPIEHMEVGTVLTVRRLLEEMGKKSDNTAPVALTRMLPAGSMRRAFTKLGMKKTDFVENTTTAYDVAMMWKYLAADHAAWMWEFLQDSIYEERIPAGVPEGIQVVHKVGSDSQVWADSGIVDGKLIIVLLNKDVNLPQAKKLVPEVVRLIWNFEQSPDNKTSGQAGQKND